MKISSQILFAFLIVILLSTIDTVSNYLLSLKVEQNIRFLNDSQDIMRNSTNLHKTIIEMQNSFRGFLLTGDNKFLENYDSGMKKITPLFDSQKNRVQMNESQTAILDSIEKLHMQWTEYANSMIDAKKTMLATAQSSSSSPIFLDATIGKKLNDGVTRKFLEFDRKEYKIRRFHSNNLIASINTTHTISFTLLLLTTLIGIFSTIYIIRLILRRIKTMVIQASEISKGNFVIIHDTRQDELTHLSDSLNAMSKTLNKNINELEKRNVELDKFAYVVSHDLKAPLRGIHNVVKWIEEDLQNELSAEMNQYLEIIRQRTKRMEDLINGLLDYARIRKKHTAEETDVGKLIAEIKETVVPDNFTIKTHSLPTIVTERFKLEQVFTNLISNAVKYTPAKKGIITIKCEEKQGYYEFSVKDNGVGIAPQFHEKIFEIFQTLRDKDEKESTGIGLAIVKKIIEEQHCTIKLESTLGSGAEFIFTWPARNTA